MHRALLRVLALARFHDSSGWIGSCRWVEAARSSRLIAMPFFSILFLEAYEFRHRISYFHVSQHRSRIGAGPAGFYWMFDANNVAVKKDSDMYKALDSARQQVGILGILSDWPATVTIRRIACCRDAA